MTEKSNRIYLLGEADVASALLKLGIPTMVGMLISALYNAIDAYFVGGLGMSQMGAVSVVFPIVQIIIGLGMMFGAGASSYISRLLGKGDNEQANKTASTSLFSGLLVGAIIIVGIMVFLDTVLTSLGATETILPYAKAYAYREYCQCNIRSHYDLWYGLGNRGSSHCYSHFFMYQYGNLYWIHSKKEGCFKVFG